MAFNILIVDDEPRYLRWMEANLITEGFQVLKATNGQEAVNMVAERHPNLVLLDVMMPVLDGFGALGKLLAVVGFGPDGVTLDGGLDARDLALLHMIQLVYLGSAIVS